MPAKKATHQKTWIRVDWTDPVTRACALISYAKENLHDEPPQIHQLHRAYRLIADLEQELAGNHFPNLPNPAQDLLGRIVAQAEERSTTMLAGTVSPGLMTEARKLVSSM